MRQRSGSQRLPGASLPVRARVRRPKETFPLMDTGCDVGFPRKLG